MGSSQSEHEQQKKSLAGRENGEQGRQKIAETKTDTESKTVRLRSSLLFKSTGIPEFSPAVDQSTFCPLQPATSSSSSKSSVCCPVKNNLLTQPRWATSSISNILKTYRPQLFSVPSEEVCEHSGGNNKPRSSHQTSASVAPSLLTASLPKSPPNASPQSVYRPPTPTHLSLCKKKKAAPKEAYLKPALPGTVQLLENTEHTPKETKTATVACAVVSQLKGPATQDPVNVQQLPLNSLTQTDSRTECVKKQEAPPDTQMQSEMQRVLNGVPCEKTIKGTPLNVSPACHEGKVKQTAQKAKMSKADNKEPTESEHVQSGAPTLNPSTTPTKILLNKNDTNPTPAKARKQVEDLTQPQNSNGLSTPAPVYKTLETSAVAPRHKTSAANSLVLPASALESHKGHQLLTKDHIPVQSTSSTGSTAKQPASPKHVSTGQSFNSINTTSKSTLACSSCSSPRSSLTSRTSLKLEGQKSKSKAVAKTEGDVTPPADHVESEEEACKNVQTETSEDAEKQTPKCPDQLTDKPSRRMNGVHQLGKSNLGTFPELKHTLEPELNSAHNFSAFQSPPSPKPSETPDGKVSEDCTTEGVLISTCSTTASDIVNREIPSEDVPDIAEDTTNILTALSSQTKARSNHAAETTTSMTAKAEVTQVRTEKDAPSPAPPPSPGHSPRPGRHWHPFTTDLACTRKARCPHRGSALLPRNIRRWLHVKQNHLCEPPWVTTATLAASLAFRMKQENEASDLCL